MKKTLLYILLALALTGAQQASAQVLLIDRGLPTANINNAAGSNRSNVDWANADPNLLVGDSFKNESSSTYSIGKIQLWVDGLDPATIGAAVPSARLFGGLDGSASFGVVSAAGVITQDSTFINGQGYQGYSGTFYAMQKVDFAVNILLAPGQTFDFFFDGNPNQSYSTPYVEASNAALSGSPQQGSNGLMLNGLVTGGTILAGDVSVWTSDQNGWDKASDVNVRVYGTVPDSGATLGLLGLALVGLCALRRKLSA